MIYIATNITSKGVKHITAFEDKKDFNNYAQELLSCSNTNVNPADSIDTLCSKLYDTGIGYGSRFHFRVSRKEAKKYIKLGAKSSGCWNL